MKHLPVFLLVSLTFIVGSCTSSKRLSAPATTPSPAIPDTLPALPVSEIDLPLKIAGKPLLAMADSLIPREFVSQGWPNYLQPSCDFRYKYRFTRSGFIVRCVDNKVTVQLQGSYQVAGGKCLCALNKPISPWVSGNCGFDKEAMRRVDIAFSTQLNFLPDYRIRTATNLDHLNALDRCTMSLFNVDMTPTIVDSIHSSINSFCATLDGTVAGLNFANYLHRTTARALQRMAVGPYGYLAINPTDIRIGTLNYTRDTFNISVGISCRPDIGSDSSSLPRYPTLPRLRSGANRGGVSLYMQGGYDYDFIGRLLNDSLRNKSFLFKGRTVMVKGVTLKGMDHHRIRIEIDFSGSYTGRIALWGTPILDTAKQTLSVPDIAYDLESKDLLVRMASTLLHSKIKHSLQGNSYLDLAAVLKANLPTLDAALNRTLAPNLFTTGHVRELKLIGLLIGEKTLQAQVMVKADLFVTDTGVPNISPYLSAK